MIKNTENLAIRVRYICDKIFSNLMYIRSSSTSLYTGFHGMIKNKIRSFQICAQNLSTEFIPNLRVFKLKPLTHWKMAHKIFDEKRVSAHRKVSMFFNKKYDSRLRNMKTKFQK